MKKNKLLVLGMVASLGLLSLTSCGNKVEPATKEPTMVAIEKNVELVANDNDYIEAERVKLTSSNKNIMGLKFEDIIVSKTDDGTYLYTTGVSNSTKDTIVLTSENIKVNDGTKDLLYLSEDIRIFEDEYITITFETEAGSSLEDVKININNGYKSIIFA